MFKYLFFIIFFVACGSDSKNAHVIDCSLGSTCNGSTIEKPKSEPQDVPSEPKSPACGDCSKPKKMKVIRIIDPCGNCKGHKDEVIFQLSNLQYVSYKLKYKKVTKKVKVCKKVCKKKHINRKNCKEKICWKECKVKKVVKKKKYWKFMRYLSYGERYVTKDYQRCSFEITEDGEFNHI